MIKEERIGCSILLDMRLELLKVDDLNQSENVSSKFTTKCLPLEEKS